MKYCPKFRIFLFKGIEQNQLTWYAHVQRMAEGRLPKIALKWMPKQKRARGGLKKKWMEGIKKARNERKLNEGQWEDRKQWSLRVGHGKTFWNRYIYRVSQEECARLWKGVPYVKVYRYNPKHLCPKLNGYGNNGQKSLKLWQLLHTCWLPNTY